MTKITIWQHMLSRGYELLLPIENTPPPPSRITHILDAREFIENHLLAVCQNPIALAEVYDHTVLRPHSCGYTLSAILFAIFADDVDEDGMHHLRTTLHNHGGVGRWACSVRDAALPRVVSASIVEEFVGECVFDWDEGG